MDIDTQHIEKRFEKGELASIWEHLPEFINRHKIEILDITSGKSKNGGIIEAVKQFIKRSGSIHLPSEMADQIREINNEIWYRGEKGDYNRSLIQEEWALKYAAEWRAHRVKEILYVVEKKADEIQKMLQ